MPGWNGNNWLHMSTGVIGADRRFVFAIGSMQPVDDATARDTVTQAIKTMFPAGRIPPSNGYSPSRSGLIPTRPADGLAQQIWAVLVRCCACSWRQARILA